MDGANRMTPQALSLVSELPSIVEAFRRGFASNSSLSSLCAILGGLALLIAATALAVRIQKRAQTPPEVDDPHALFETLLQTLKLTRVQRSALRRRVFELQLPQPAAVFLSPKLFDRAMAPETDCPRESPRGSSADHAWRRIRQALFGNQPPLASRNLVPD